ncbi:MAG: S8 family peptidase [Lachnospiraceae bacterium]|nr:S8 family peptidase [Lachnospiraceae bacterium]
MNCRDKILSEDVQDYITDIPIEEISSLLPIVCSQKIDETYGTVYIDSERGVLPDSNLFEYQGIPKLYGLMQSEGDDVILSPGYVQPPFDPAALIASGISQVQGPPLKLTGMGTLLCFIDTGIDYTSPVFRDEAGNTRIEAIWDQTIQSGNPPEGFSFGTEYTKAQINQALRSENPWESVPTRDEIRHGTAIAAAAAGSVTGGGAVPENSIGIPAGFLGAAPDAGIVVVKLKSAKEYLRRYYLIPPDALAFQENDMMLAVRYCVNFVRLFQRPIVICIALGTSFGDHSGTSLLSDYLNKVAVRRNCTVVVCGGNEGNNAHHFRGSFKRSSSEIQDALTSPARDAEIRVADQNSGFYMELWGRRTNVLNVSIRSPGGEVIPPIPLGLRQSITFGFVYERTLLTVYSVLVEPSSGDELILFRLEEPTPGIWTIRVISQSSEQGGEFDLWLPITQFQYSPVYFLSPDPDVTLTEPAMAGDVISVSAYNAANNGFYIDSGRGYSRTGLPRPDLAAPGVDLSTLYGRQSGSGFAAALTAGAAAQFFQWAVTEGNSPYAESRVIKSYLVRGAKREADISYPSREWGYGRLDMAGVFASLRV